MGFTRSRFVLECQHKNAWRRGVRGNVVKDFFALESSGFVFFLTPKALYSGAQGERSRVAAERHPGGEVLHLLLR